VGGVTGTLHIVGLGPGAPEHRTDAAAASVRQAETVIGYGPYVDYCADLLSETQSVVRLQMGQESERARVAVQRAAAGERVALVCTGDPGVYGMAARTFVLAAELAPQDRPHVELIPGVTAALVAAARLGAPLCDDFAVVSLSDLHLEWETIERRLDALAASGVALCLYNPRSRTRTWQLARVLELLRRHRDDDTPVGIVTDVTRERERVTRATLATLDEELVTMRTVLIVAGDTASDRGGWIVAQRSPTGERAARDGATGERAAGHGAAGERAARDGAAGQRAAREGAGR
jgi:precorrin-3B C17-methyltransferase